MRPDHNSLPDHSQALGTTFEDEDSLPDEGRGRFCVDALWVAISFSKYSWR
jgi:hypothetical protein